MKNICTKVTTVLSTLFVFALLNGCENTVSGFGKDMQKTGQEIQKSAQ